MRLKLLVVAIPLILVLGGCSVQFPLADNGPSLTSHDDSSSDDSNSRDVDRGNTAPTPDLPH